MQKVLIHSMPRSGSKTLQRIIQHSFIQADKNPLTLNGPEGHYGLDEFFVNKEDPYHYFLDSAAYARLLKLRSDETEFPPGAYWKVIAEDETGLAWVPVPTDNEPTTDDAMLAARLDILKPHADRFMVAKVFDGKLFANIKKTGLLNSVSSFFDTNIILLRRDLLLCFISNTVCWHTGVWAGEDTTAVKRMQPFRMERDEFEMRCANYVSFIKYVKTLKNATVVYLEDMVADPQYLKDKLDLDVEPEMLSAGREYIGEHGENLEFSLLQNYFEVKRWFKAWTPPTL